MAAREPVDVVVPFFGSDEALKRLCARLARTLGLDPRDTLTVVDNRPTAPPSWRTPDGCLVLPAPQVQSSYFARNVGAAAGVNPWILFIDADVEVPSELLSEYFAGRWDPQTGQVAGGIEDTAEPNPTWVSRYATARGSVAHSTTDDGGPFSYAQTANTMVRRSAFESVGGFSPHLVSGGDADLTFRLVGAGWALARAHHASVFHTNRTRLRDLVRQAARYGAGSAWLEEQYPGFSPGRPFARMVIATTLIAPLRVLRQVFRGRLDEATYCALDAIVGAAFDVGRRRPNVRDVGTNDEGEATR